MAEHGPFRVFVDGHCPICRREGDFLAWMDGGRNRVLVEDLTAPDFDVRRYGLTHDQVMAEIHGVTWDGRVVKGMEVFRIAYSLLGLGFLTAPTGWPLIRPLADAAYKLFARNRLRLAAPLRICSGGQCRVR